MGLASHSSKTTNKYAQKRKMITKSSQHNNVSYFAEREGIDLLELEHNQYLRFMIRKVRAVATSPCARG